MIRAMVQRRAADRKIDFFEVKGHANFAARGKDIVCAAVSAVTVGTVNAVEELLGVVPEAESTDGLLRVRLSDSAFAERGEDVQLLLESMLVMLRSIEASYGKHIQIREEVK